VPPLLESRILRIVEASRPAPVRERFHRMPVAAVVAALLLLGAGVAWTVERTLPSPAGVVHGSWSSAPSMAIGRGYHTATLLHNGKGLVVGGSQEFSALSTAELYDPASRTWSRAGTPIGARVDHTATLLRSGKVLLVGGARSLPTFGLDILASAELYDPQTNSWSPASTMRTPRAKHTATLLDDGRVLIVGGVGDLTSESARVLASAELYDPVSNSWSAVPSLAQARAWHSAVLLADHRVLVLGGADWNRSNGIATGTAPTNHVEVYDPATNRWSAASSMHFTRILPTSTLLPDGRVLVVGDSGPNERTAEIFDPRTGRWTVSNPGVKRAGHVAVGLRNGNVLVAGGLGEMCAQIFDWRRNNWLNGGELSVVRSGATATSLGAGQVLVVGGFNLGDLSRDAMALASGEQYDPAGVRNGVTGPAGSRLVLPGGGLTSGVFLGAIAFLVLIGGWLRTRYRARRFVDDDAWTEPELT